MTEYTFRRTGKFISGYAKDEDPIHFSLANVKEAEVLMRYLPSISEPVDFSSDDIDICGTHDF